MTSPLPENERERLAALHRLRVLDTVPEEVFDRIVRLASTILDVPIALVSLVDADRQWFKASVGLGARETSRDVAFCAHTILDDEILVVEDATQDQRFRDNPLVTGQPDIRFYAGAPLIAAGDLRIGTLCAIDRAPRSLSERESTALRDLADMTMAELELRAENATQRDLLEMTRRALDLSHVGVLSFSLPDLSLQVTDEALSVLGYARHEIHAPMNAWTADQVHPRDRDDVQACVQRLAQGRTEVEECFARIRRCDGSYAWFAITLFRGESQLLGTIRDVDAAMASMAELRRMNDDLRLFTRAIAHDMSEPLRAVIGFGTRLQSQATGLVEPQRTHLGFMVEGAERMREQIEGLRAYLVLEQDALDAERVELSEVLRDVGDDLRLLLDGDAELHVGELPAVRGVRHQLRALFQNLVQNALKFRRTEVPARVQVFSRARDGAICVEDNGVGLPEGAAERAFELFARLHRDSRVSGSGVGLTVCKRIVELHDGRIWHEPAEAHGARFCVSLPLAEPGE